MKKKILNSIDGAIKAIKILREKDSISFIESSAKMIAESFLQGGKLIIAGNGGSLCDAMHFAEELTGQFRQKRAALPAIAISDPGHLTCTANDMGFESVFSRGIEAYGKPNDVFVALSTSGNSPNLIQAVIQAKKQKLKTIAFLGKSGGLIKGRADLEWIVAGFSTSDRIQEVHMAAIHICIEMIENLLFPSKKHIKKTLSLA